MQTRSFGLFTLLFLATIVLPGCGGDDDPVASPTTGTIVIDTRDALDTPWLLAGPDDLDLAGIGDREYTDMTPGQYELTWLAVSGYATPPAEVADLEAGSTVVFDGEYRVPGTVRVTIDPRTLPVPWTLTGPDGFSHEGVGTEYLDDRFPGTYQVVWTTPDSWRLAQAQMESLELTDDGDIEFHAEYTLLAGPRTTLDDAVEHFQISYDAEMLDLFTDVLSDDFVFIKTDGSSLDRDAMMLATQKMMTEVQGQGGLAFEDISVVLLSPLEIWAPVLDDDPIFGGFDGCMKRVYNIGLEFDVLGQALIYQVRGLVVLFAHNEGTEESPDFHVLGVIDDTWGGKANDAISWSRIIEVFE